MRGEGDTTFQRIPPVKYYIFRTLPLGDKLVDAETVFLIPISKVPTYHIRDRLLSSLWIHLLRFILLLSYHSLLMKYAPQKINWS